MLIRPVGSGGGASAIAAKENGSAVVAAADTFDFKDLNVEDAGSNDAAVYLNLPHICQGRLTLVTGQPVYTPQAAQTPSATDTGADTVDFAAAHGWVTGTMVTPSATAGGLTLGTTYYVNAVDSDTISFHTTLAAALAGTSKVDLTASITAQILPIGVAGSTLYWTPYRGNRTSLYDGTRWKVHAVAESSIALTGLTSGKPYDVFLYDNAGTPTLELLVWTSDTVRATALALQDGVYVKSGATTRRYLGTIYTTATDATEISWSGRPAQIYVWNYYNQEELPVFLTDYTSSHTYSTSTVRQFRADTANQVNAVIGVNYACRVNLRVAARFQGTNAGDLGAIGIGEDSTTRFAQFQVNQLAEQQVGMHEVDFLGYYHRRPLAGRRFFAWLQYGSGTVTWYGWGVSGGVQLWSPGIQGWVSA